MKENQGKSSIEQELSKLLQNLSVNQIRFIVALQEYPSKREAAEALEIKPDTVYHWPKEVDLAAALMAADGLVVAQTVRRRSLAKAMLVKVSGLDSEDENVRQRASTEIIEWEMGKAKQAMELTGEDGGPIQVEFVNDWRDTPAISPRGDTDGTEE